MKVLFAGCLGVKTDLYRRGWAVWAPLSRFPERAPYKFMTE